MSAMGRGGPNTATAASPFEARTLIAEERIRKALEKAATFTAADPAFLPVFERLECELTIIQAKNSTPDGTKALAQSTKGIGNLAA
ncbi:MAG: hypothetical protein ACU0CA_06980 [Paracoccaceae bacterium]